MSASGRRIVGSHVGTLIEPMLLPAIGCVGVSARPRTRSRPLRAAPRQVEEQAVGRVHHGAILHDDACERAETLRKRHSELCDSGELHVTGIGPVMSVHLSRVTLRGAFFAE